MIKRLLSQKMEEFKEYLILTKRSGATIEKYLRDVNKFIDFSKGTKITKEIVIKYKKSLIAFYAPRSVNSMLASLNCFFSFLDRDDLKVKTVKLQNQIYRSESKELTKAEYLELCKAAEATNNQRLNLILQTICGTGIRISELKYITLESVKRGEASVNCKGKTRTVFIIKELQKKLLKYAKVKNIKKGIIFRTRNGKPVNRTSIWREMKAICKIANVNPQKVFPHNLRHLFARTFYSFEKDIVKLADVLGHGSINTTRIYIMSTGIEHRKRMESMHLVI